MESELKCLPVDTIRLLGSSQVITSIQSIVKELIENSFDASASVIDVKLENYGLDKLEVRDNGYGIDQDAIPVVAKRHHTSKISCFGDLERLTTYGFRGEAVGSLCAVANLSIITKTKDADVGHSYSFDHHGNITAKQPSHLGKGTTVIATNLFKTVPVRRQLYNTLKKKKEELKKIEELLMIYGAIRPAARITLTNNKELIWQKTAMVDTKGALLAVFGRSVASQLECRTAKSEDGLIKLVAYLPTASAVGNATSRSVNDRCFIAINDRPVQHKQLEKCVREHYSNHKSGADGRYPVFYLHVTVPPGDIDVNLDPNKTRVLLHQQKTVLSLLRGILEDVYGPLSKNTNNADENCSPDSSRNLSSQGSTDSECSPVLLGPNDHNKASRNRVANAQRLFVSKSDNACMLKNRDIIHINVGSEISGVGHKRANIAYSISSETKLNDSSLEVNMDRMVKDSCDGKEADNFRENDYARSAHTSEPVKEIHDTTVAERSENVIADDILALLEDDDSFTELPKLGAEQTRTHNSMQNNQNDETKNTENGPTRIPTISDAAALTESTGSGEINSNVIVSRSNAIEKVLSNNNIAENGLTKDGCRRKEINEEDLVKDDSDTQGSIRTKIQETLGNFVEEGTYFTQLQRKEVNFDIMTSDIADLLQTQNTTTSDNCIPVAQRTENGTKNDADVLPAADMAFVTEVAEACRNTGTADAGVGSVGALAGGTGGDVQMTTSVDVNGQTKLEWSKGVGEANNGRQLNPVQLLACGSHVTKKRALSPTLDTTVFSPPTKKSTSFVEPNQPKLYEVVSKNVGEKYPVGFVAFSKEMRPKLLEEMPDSVHDEITAAVSRRWSNLSDADRRTYEERGSEQMKDLKKKVNAGKKLLQKLDRRLSAVKGTPSIKEQLLGANRKSGGNSSNAPVKSVRVAFSIKQLQDIYSTGLQCTQSQMPQELKLIGPLKFYNGWVCCHGNKIKIINPHRIEETLVYRQLMEYHIIQATKLETPSGITQSSIGGPEMYDCLLGLVPSNTMQTYVYIEDIRLKANGFQVRCHLDESGEPVLELVAMATSMPMYSIRDLQEVLEHIVRSKARTLYATRPLKVKYYLQGEAVRMIRQRPVKRSREEMLTLLEQMTDTLPSDCTTCLHNKPFSETVYNFNDVMPVSQMEVT